LPIAFWDERLSSAAVERFLIDEADMTRRKRALVIDKMAAPIYFKGRSTDCGWRGNERINPEPGRLAGFVYGTGVGRGP
jgi:hypothetical protein